MSNDCYTYELAYPESMGGKVFYVGQGSGDRWLVHEAEAKRGASSEKSKIIRSIWTRGEQVVRRKVADNIDSGTSRKLEQQLIIRYGLKNLTNQRGEGRDRPMQFMVTSEVADWLEQLRIERGERSLSNVIFDLLVGELRKEFPEQFKNS